MRPKIKKLLEQLAVASENLTINSIPPKEPMVMSGNPQDIPQKPRPNN